MNKKRRFKGGEIPTSSMADIAFLLLIFFLVTTTIDMDKGLGIVLPAEGEELEIKKTNILNCLINSQGNVLLGGDPVAFTKRYTGSPDPEVIKNYSNEIQKNIESIPVDQESNSIMKRTNELGAEVLDRTNFSPNIQPTVSQLMNPKETEDIGEEWKRIEKKKDRNF